MPLNFDLIDPNPVHLDGTLTAVALDPDNNPNQVFQRDLPWSIQVNWSIFGTISPAIGGDWTVRAYMESIGAGFEGQVGPTLVIPVNSPGTLPPPRNYSATINVPAGTPPNEGVYKLTVLLNHSNMGIRDKMAGFTEGPMVEFYNPV
jgi:hypothetical protein